VAELWPPRHSHNPTPKRFGSIKDKAVEAYLKTGAQPSLAKVIFVCAEKQNPRLLGWVKKLVKRKPSAILRNYAVIGLKRRYQEGWLRVAMTSPKHQEEKFRNTS